MHMGSVGDAGHDIDTPKRKRIVDRRIDSFTRYTSNRSKEKLESLSKNFNSTLLINDLYHSGSNDLIA